MTSYATEEEIRKIEQDLLNLEAAVKDNEQDARHTTAIFNAVAAAEEKRAAEKQLELQRSPALLRDLPVRAHPLGIKKGLQP